MGDVDGLARSGVAQRVRPVAKPVEQYALRLGDDALLFSFRLGERLSGTPDLDAQLALANVAHDLRGQARFLLAAAGQSTAQDEDLLAYQRSDREYRNALIVELPNRDFAHTVVRLLFFSAYQCVLYRALEHSADANLAAFAAKALHEAEHHFEYSSAWTVRLGDGDEENHDRVSVAVAELWPYTAELFAADELISALVSEGVAADPVALQGRWSEQIGAVLAQATLGVAPTGAYRPSGGRAGLHTGALGELLRLMRSFRRGHPGAAW